MPTDRDKRDFRLSYLPERPTKLDGLSDSFRASTVIVAWDAVKVHVEKEFAIQRKTRDASWETVTTHAAVPLPPRRPGLDATLPPDPQVRRSEVTGQTPGGQTYRVVAMTDAPLQDGYVAASGEIRITVLAPAPPVVPCPVPGLFPDLEPCTLPAPTELVVSNVTHTSATLSWGDVTAATGYKVRLDEVANSTATLGDVNSHTFTGLTIATAHLLEVASSTSAGDSYFASLRLLVPPVPLADDATHNSITLSWTGVARATAYDVRLGAGGPVTEAEGGIVTRLHVFPDLDASTSYTLYVRATNAQGPSAWADTTKETKSRPTTGPGTPICEPGIPPCLPPLITDEQRQALIDSATMAHADRVAAYADARDEGWQEAYDWYTGLQRSLVGQVLSGEITSEEASELLAQYLVVYNGWIAIVTAVYEAAVAASEATLQANIAYINSVP